MELRPEGSSTDVTQENKHEYVSLMLNYLTFQRIEKQLLALKKGFSELIPNGCVCMVKCDDISKLLVGKECIDVGEIRATTNYGGIYSETSTQILWFWQVSVVVVVWTPHFFSYMHE